VDGAADDQGVCEDRRVTTEDLTALGTEDFDAFVQGLDYPMFVVTTAAADERSGCLVGFTTQAGIDPPRLLVCLSVKNHTYRVAQRAELLAVHVLDPDQRDLAKLFGEQTGDTRDKFSQCSWRPGPGGVPLLEDCPRFLVGRVLERHDFGDHVGHLLEPVAVESRSAEDGLGFEDVEDLDPGHDP
jgi:flavin reductase (DIM6/NTAB) family NADH-FMN oxidoreductase RutF